MPLAHLLAPQIMARAQEIEDALGPPTMRSYLASTADVGEKTPYDPRGVLDDKKPEKAYNSRTPGGQVLAGLGMMQQSGDPIAQRVAKAFLAGNVGKVLGTQGVYTPPQAGKALDPKSKRTVPLSPANPMPGSTVIGMTETGEPIYGAPGADPMATEKRPKLQLKKGEAVGIDERGESVDRKGKKMGYLKQDGAQRNLLRGERDIFVTDKGLVDRDRFGAQALERLFGPHLKAVEGNTDANGAPTDEFPPNYFDKIDPVERKNIEMGVRALRMLQRGERT